MDNLSLQHDTPISNIAQAKEECGCQTFKTPRQPEWPRCGCLPLGYVETRVEVLWI